MNNERLTKKILTFAFLLKIKNWLTGIEKDLQEINITETTIYDGFTFGALIYNYQFPDTSTIRSKKNLD